MDLSEGVAQTNNARAPSHSTSAPYVAGGPSQPQTQSSAANLFNNFVTQNPQVLSNGAATSMLPGTGLFGSNKTAGSVTPFAGFGGQAEAKPTNFSTFASGSGLFNARTDTNNKSGWFGSNVTGDGKSVFGSTSPFGQPAKPAASTGGLFGSTSVFGQPATLAASTGDLFGKSQTDPIDRPRSTGSILSGSGGFKNPNANGEGPASGKSQMISYYTPTKGTGGWFFKSFDSDGARKDHPEGSISIWGPQTSRELYQSLTAHKRFSLSSFEVSTSAHMCY